jgi:hypothetical protein
MSLFRPSPNIGKTRDASRRQGFGYIVVGLSLATNLSRLTTVYWRILEVTEIERNKLRVSNRLPASLLSSRGDYGHGQDVGIEVHIFVFVLMLVLVVNTELTLLDTAILLSVSTGQRLHSS